MHIKKGTIERKKRILSLLLCAALLCSFIPQGMAVASASSNSGLCEHHTEHTEDCGYSERTEGSPCTHDHTEDCYILAMSCVHSHDATCYLDETDLDNSATTSDMEWSGPITCTHVCSEESGCIIKELNCIHEHDNTCGYLAASEGMSCT